LHRLAAHQLVVTEVDRKVRAATQQAQLPATGDVRGVDQLDRRRGLLARRRGENRFYGVVSTGGVAAAAALARGFMSCAMRIERLRRLLAVRS
jgi:hypothetical protein